LLLGERNYGPEVDMWSVGCIMAEIWTRVPIMRGDTQQEQLKLICHLCGTINAEVWPGVTSLRLYNAIELPQKQKRKVRQHLMQYVRDPCACELLDLLLVLDPGKRYSSDAALDHDFFWTDPMPCDLSKMLASFYFTRATDGQDISNTSMNPQGTDPKKLWIPKDVSRRLQEGVLPCESGMAKKKHHQINSN
jgi:serine/threonine protein kinase